MLDYGRPLLGVCLGMQLLAEAQRRGRRRRRWRRASAWYPAAFGTSRVGCDAARPARRLEQHHAGLDRRSTCSKDIPDGTDFYFVHSYALRARARRARVATTDYGVPVTAAVRRGHVWGTQFHPEKSSRAGFQLLRNFIAGPCVLKVRVIPTLLWKQFGLVKGVGFDSWRRVGPVLPAIKVYNQREVDELVLRRHRRSRVR